MKVIRKYGLTTALTYGEREWVKKTAESQGMTASEFMRHAFAFYKHAIEQTMTTEE